MGPEEEFDEKALIESVREKLRVALGEAPLPPPVPRPDPPSDSSDDALEVELNTIRETYDICSVPLRSYRKAISSVIVAARKAARRLVGPSLEAQVAYNAANHRIIRGLYDRLRRLEDEHKRMMQRYAALETELERFRSKAAGG